MSNHLIPSIDAPVTTGQSVLTALAELVAPTWTDARPSTCPALLDELAGAAGPSQP